MKMIFSATIPRAPHEFQKLKLRCPIVFLSSRRSKFSVPDTLTQYQYYVETAKKPLALAALLDSFKPLSVLVFTLSLDTTHRLYHFLKLSGFKAGECSSDVSPKARKKILK